MSQNQVWEKKNQTTQTETKLDLRPTWNLLSFFGH